MSPRGPAWAYTFRERLDRCLGLEKESRQSNRPLMEPESRWKQAARATPIKLPSSGS